MSRTSEDTREGYDPKHPVRIYTDGIFDCFHYGHARVLEQCKKFFPNVYLVVGVCRDEDTKEEKGHTIMSLKERMECVKHCKWVDEVVVGPWICSLEFLDSINCKYIAHDPEPYPYNNIPDVYGPFKKANRFLATKRTEGISTTDIINRVLVDYDRYIERNVKKGLKPKELNISNEKYFSAKINLLWKSIEKRKENNPLQYYFIIWRGKTKTLSSKDNSINSIDDESTK